MIAEPPAETMLAPIEKAEGFGVKVWPATVKIGVEGGLVRGIVLLPMARFPDRSRLIIVPSMV